MSHAILDKIDAMLKDSKNFTPEMMEGLVQELLQVLTIIQGQLASPDEEKRNEAIQLSTALRTKLEKHAHALCQSFGIDPESMSMNFSAQDGQAFQKARLVSTRPTFIK